MTDDEQPPADADDDADAAKPEALRSSAERYGSLPGLARLAGNAGWRSLQWMVTESVTTGEGIIEALAAGESPAPVIREATSDAWSAATQTLGLAHEDQGSPADSRRHQTGAASAELRARGAELLHRSADVRSTDDTHPAYERILDELAPDEARVLRFLAVEGPQPAVDVRTSRLLGIGSELVAGGLSMIGLQAGVRSLERTPAYLNNLFRLGLIWFSREPVEVSRYQVVEVQPEVTEAMKRAGRASKTVRRSIHLTPFGEDFCQTCLPPPTTVDG